MRKHLETRGILRKHMTRIATIIIGRNEGERLVACLNALQGDTGDVVYVDSGSTDGSIDAAKAAGAQVVMLDTATPFTAARARNAGVAALTQPHALLQFIDGDCTLDHDWTAAATAFLANHPDVGVVCGRRRERFPDRSIYNALCDDEWDTPIGEAKSCGGDALMRFEAFEAAGRFDPNLIAGEEPELCVRIRAAGWRVWRLDAEMTLHDAAMLRFGQFWQRAKRAGHAFAEGAHMHGSAPEYHNVTETRRALLWGVAIPAVIICATLLFGLWALLLALIYPAQIARLALKAGGHRNAWTRAALLTVGKFAESWGIIRFYKGRYLGQRAKLIEYK